MSQASVHRQDRPVSVSPDQSTQALSGRARILSLARRDAETGAISGAALESFLDAACRPESGKRRKIAFTLGLFRCVETGDFQDSRNQVKALSASLGIAFPEARGYAIFALPSGMVALFMPEMQAEDALGEIDIFRSSTASQPAFDIPSFGVGLASFPGHGLQGSHLIRRAEEALCISIERRGAIRIARKERMVMKTAYYTKGQSARLSDLAERLGKTESILLREALEDLCAKYEPSSGPGAGGINRLRAALLELMHGLVEEYDRARGEAGHSVAVSDLARALARELDLDQETETLAGTAGLLHDIGRGPAPGTDNCSDGHCERGAAVLRSTRLFAHLADTLAAHHPATDISHTSGAQEFQGNQWVGLLVAAAEAFDGQLRGMRQQNQQVGLPSEALQKAADHTEKALIPLAGEAASRALAQVLRTLLDAGWTPAWMSESK